MWTNDKEVHIQEEDLGEAREEVGRSISESMKAFDSFAAILHRKVEEKGSDRAVKNKIKRIRWWLKR